MIAFPNCKINLGLHIVGKRNDGFHNLETIFYPIQLRDAVEIIVSPQSKTVSYSSSGNNIEGKEEDNLCIKAFHLLKKDFPQLPNIQLHLHKVIPTGAGLGGGSADAAFTLTLLNKKFNLNLSNTQLINYAAELGSDCPFFVINRPCFATGRGELLEEIQLDLSAYKFILVNPKIHVNTGWAFSQIAPTATPYSLKEIVTLPITSWRENITNDFEKIVFAKYEAVKKAKEELYNKGALYAAMSGSGSTVFGIFEKKNNVLLDFPIHYFVKELNT